MPSSPVAVSMRVASSSPAMPPVAMAGTAMAAEFRSPRRRAWAARATVAEEDGRSAGFFAIIAMTRFCTGIGTVGGSGGGCSLICAMAIATCDSPVKGRLPARHSYATMPSEYVSVAGRPGDPTPAPATGTAPCP